MGLKVLHVECGAKLRGGPRQVLYLMEGLKRRGHESVLLCYEHSPMRREAERMGFRTLPCPAWCMVGPFLAAFVFLATRRERPDVVHLHSRRGADTWGALGARLAHARAVVLSRRVTYRIRPRFWARLRFRLLYDGVVAVSEAVRDALIRSGVPEGMVTVVRSALDLSRFERLPSRGEARRALGLPEGAPVCVTVGALERRKGQALLLKAAAMVRERVPDAVFLLVGDGPKAAELREEAERMGLSGSVRFLGWRDDVPRILSAADLLVHPALREGIPGAAMEAGAAGLPAVAFEVGGVPEVVEHGRTGLLVPPGDVEGLARAVVSLLTDGRRREEMGRAARERVEREFSAERMVEGNIEVYLKALARRGRGG